MELKVLGIVALEVYITRPCRAERIVVQYRHVLLLFVRNFIHDHQICSCVSFREISGDMGVGDGTAANNSGYKTHQKSLGIGCCPCRIVPCREGGDDVVRNTPHQSRVDFPSLTEECIFAV